MPDLPALLAAMKPKGEEPRGASPNPLMLQTHSRNYLASVRATSEHHLGILHFVSAVDFGWHGDIRKRFTDFQVNEIRKDGLVLHLTDYEMPEDPREQATNGANRAGIPPGPANGGAEAIDQDIPTFRISDADLKFLQDVLSEEVARQLVDLGTRTLTESNLRPSSANTVTFVPIFDREKRGAIHREIRRIFDSRIETQTDNNGVITAIPFARRSSRGYQNTRRGGVQVANGAPWVPRGNQRPFKELGGEYLHFTLYKENKDTMDAINHIARMLKIKSSNFGFAGTKDRRAATVQRCSVQRVRAEQLKYLNKRMPAIKIGDFNYHKHPIQLGDHGGNYFVIVVKNCHLARDQGCSIHRRLEMMKHCVRTALKNATQNGFINYFGLQRFGTHTIGTQELGMMILRGDFEGAVDALLHVDDYIAAEAFTAPEPDTASSRDELARARAIATWRTTGNSDAALTQMPKRFSAEGSIIRHLGKSLSTRRDFCGALLTITRGMRMMYIHAYQSWIWNHVASERWARYGTTVIPGDLVLEDSGMKRDRGKEDDFMDAQDETFYQKARALTAEEAESGQYTIFDIVLPAPGFDVLYPINDIGEFYVELMAKEEFGCLDPYDMRRQQREFSLSGAYRKLIAKFIGTSPSFEVIPYVDDNIQVHPTDLDLINRRKQGEKKDDKKDDKKDEKDVLEERKPVVNAWKQFAANPASFDHVIAAERRRQREVDPNSEAEPRLNDMWIQTELDGSSKRLRVQKHAHVLDAPTADTGVEASAPVATVPEAAFGIHDEKSGGHTDFSRPVRQPTVPGFGAGFSKPAEAIAFPTGSSQVFDPSQAPYISNKPQSKLDAAQTSAILERLHQLPDPQTSATPTMIDAEGRTVGQRSSPPLAFDGTHRTTSAASVSSKRYSSSTASTQEDGGPGSPRLQTELTEDMKIAVVLNFGLSTSSYATIALRELMGAVAPESKEGSPTSSRSNN